jgi:spermidine synthase
VLRDPRVRRVVVVEIEAELVHWMRGGTVPHGPRLLANERLSVTVGDIRDAISRTPPAAYDLVLLDVDNGPGQLVHEANAAIYRRDFLARVHEVTRPAGALAVWSAERSPALESELRAVFGNVAVLAHDVLLQTRQERFWLFCCQRRAS